MSQERRRRRILAVSSLGVAAAVLAFFAFGGIGENLVYYWSPTEMKDAGASAVGASVRLGGLVAPGTLARGANGLDLRFQVTDGAQAVWVNAHTVPPAMFREGIGVVVEGSLRKDGEFETNRLMVKHDNEYQPPGEGDERTVRDLMESLEGGDA